MGTLGIYRDCKGKMGGLHQGLHRGSSEKLSYPHSSCMVPHRDIMAGYTLMVLECLGYRPQPVTVDERC